MIAELDSKGGATDVQIFNKLTEVIRALNAMETGNTSTNNESLAIALLKDCRDIIHQLPPKVFDAQCAASTFFVDTVTRLNKMLAQQQAVS